jgi:hypothetical protein
MSHALYLFAVLAVFVVVLRVHEHVTRSWRVHRLRLVCPRGRGAVQCSVVWDRSRKVWTGVERCTGFPHPREISCARDCVPLLNARFLPSEEA